MCHLGTESGVCSGDSNGFTYVGEWDIEKHSKDLDSDTGTYKISIIVRKFSKIKIIQSAIRSRFYTFTVRSYRYLVLNSLCSKGSS